MKLTIENAVRSREQYTADLMGDGAKIGRVEKSMSQGGFRASDYVAWVGGTRVAWASTLAELRADLRDDEVASEVAYFVALEGEGA